METPNKIKFIDDDGSVEVLDPPMTARVHVETPNQEENVPDTIEEESSSDEDIVVVSSSAEGEINDISSSVESISNLKPVIETEVVEQHVKDLEKMESVIASSIEAIQGSPDVIKTDEVKVPEK